MKDLDHDAEAVWAIIATATGADPDPTAFVAYCRSRKGPGSSGFVFSDRTNSQWAVGFYGGRNLMSSITLDTYPERRRDLDTVAVLCAANDNLCFFVEGALKPIGPLRVHREALAASRGGTFETDPALKAWTAPRSQPSTTQRIRSRVSRVLR